MCLPSKRASRRVARSVLWTACAALAAMPLAPAQERQEKGARINVDHYAIDAEINPRTQSIAATVKVRFTPLEDKTQAAVFELNNALNVSRVADDAGHTLSSTRSQQDFSVRVNFPDTLPKGKPATLTFTYDGVL